MVVFLVFTMARRWGGCYWNLVMESGIINVLQCLGQSCRPIQNVKAPLLRQIARVIRNGLLKRGEPYALGRREIKS